MSSAATLTFLSYTHLQCIHTVGIIMKYHHNLTATLHIHVKKLKDSEQSETALQGYRALYVSCRSLLTNNKLVNCGM